MTGVTANPWPKTTSGNGPRTRAGVASIRSPGTGLPSAASASEQTYRAQLLYKRSNWRTQWPVCGHNLFS